LPEWSVMAAPKHAIDYYDLPANATMKDMFMHIRADEASHRELNHHFADIPSHHTVEHQNVEMISKEAEDLGLTAHRHTGNEILPGDKNAEKKQQA